METASNELINQKEETAFNRDLDLESLLSTIYDELNRVAGLSERIKMESSPVVDLWINEVNEIIEISDKIRYWIKEQISVNDEYWSNKRNRRLMIYLIDARLVHKTAMLWKYGML